MRKALKLLLALSVVLALGLVWGSIPPPPQEPVPMQLKQDEESALGPPGGTPLGKIPKPFEPVPGMDDGPASPGLPSGVFDPVGGEALSAGGLMIGGGGAGAPSPVEDAERDMKRLIRRLD